MASMLLEEVVLSKKFLTELNSSYNHYFVYGPRSSKKVDHFHNFIKTEINKFLDDHGLTHTYKCDTEVKVKSLNASGWKKCDVVILKDKVPFVVFPIKMVMSNYKQNKNNNWENLTGELLQMKWAHTKTNELKIIPINIFMNLVPYLGGNKMIKKFETIGIEDIQIYNTLYEKNIVSNMLNIIVDVHHYNAIGEKYTKNPSLLCFNKNTKFTSIQQILSSLF